jgi:hypothetical protein
MHFCFFPFIVDGIYVIGGGPEPWLSVSAKRKCSHKHTGKTIGANVSSD